MQRNVLLSLPQKDLEANFFRLQQAVEDLEFCLVTVLEEQDELQSTNQMYNEIASTLKSTGQEQSVSLSRSKSSQWNAGMHEILNERHSLPIEKTGVTKKYKKPCKDEMVEEEKVIKRHRTEYMSSSKPTEESYDEDTKTSECSEHIDLPRHYANNTSTKSINKAPWRTLADAKKPSRMRRVRTQISK